MGTIAASLRDVGISRGDLEADDMAQCAEVAVAMDWGGSWLRVGVIDHECKLLWQSRSRNPTCGNRVQLLKGAFGLLQEAIPQSQGKRIAGIGIALAGPVDADTGVMYGSPHLAPLNGISLKTVWEPLLGLPIWVRNDADLAALGEFHCGVGRAVTEQGQPCGTLVYLTISTGIGGGVVHQGEVFLGAHGLAAEIGHMVIDRSTDAPRCLCGNVGCLEALASGTAIARIASQRMAVEFPQVLSGSGGGAITSEMVFEAAYRGNEAARAILEDVVDALSVGLVNVLHLYDPDVIVLGGGVTQGMKELDLLPRIRSLMLGRAMSQRYKNVRLEVARLGDDAGLVGAASLVWNSIQRS